MNMRSNIIFIFTIVLSGLPAFGAPHSSNSPIAYTLRAMKKHPFASASIIALGTSCWIYKTQTKKDKKNDSKNEKLVAIIEKINDTNQHKEPLSENDEKFCLSRNSKEVEIALRNYKIYLTTNDNYKNSFYFLHRHLVSCSSPASFSATAHDMMTAQRITTKLLKDFSDAKKAIENGTLQTVNYPENGIPLLETTKAETLKKRIADFNRYAAAFVNRNKNAPAELIAALNKAHQPESFFMKEIIGAIAVGSAIGIAGAYGLHTLLSYTDY